MKIMRSAFLLVLLSAVTRTGYPQDLIQEINFERASRRPGDSAPSSNKRLSCAETAQPPVMDGRLDDGCWANAPKAKGFVITGSGRIPAEPTEAKVLYDKQALYIGFICHESQMSKLVAPERPHDYPMWNDDVIEVFLDPSDQRKEDYHFILSAGGAQYDGHERLISDMRGGHMDEGPKWNGAWQGAVFRGPDFWSAEMAIPFATLGLQRPPENTSWALELMREEQPRGEVSVWSGPAGGFGRMANWGYVLFGNPEVMIRSLTLGAPGWGENVAKVTVENAGKDSLQVVLVPEVTSPGGPVAADQKPVAVTLAPGETTTANLSFALDKSSGANGVNISCMDPARKRTFATRSVQFEMPTLLNFSLGQALLYVSDDVLIGTVEVGAADRSLAGLRLVGMMRSPDGASIESKPVQCAGRKGEVVFRVPKGGAGEYVVSLVLRDADAKDLASCEARFQRIRGPFDK